MGGEFSSVHLPARFVSAGQTVISPGWVHPKRLLNSHVLIVVKQGRFGMAVNGREYVLSAGQAFLMPAGLEHCGFRAEQEEAPVYYWAHFEDESLSGRDRQRSAPPKQNAPGDVQLKRRRSYSTSDFRCHKILPIYIISGRRFCKYFYQYLVIND